MSIEQRIEAKYEDEDERVAPKWDVDLVPTSEGVASMHSSFLSLYLSFQPLIFFLKWVRIKWMQIFKFW